MVKWFKKLFGEKISFGGPTMQQVDRVGKCEVDEVKMPDVHQIFNQVAKEQGLNKEEIHYLNSILGDMHVVDRFEMEWLNDKNEGYDN